MCTWDLQETWCHLLLAVNCEVLGFHLTNLQCANKQLYTLKSQAVGIVLRLGAISVFPKFSAWKESSVQVKLRACSVAYVEEKEML